MYLHVPIVTYYIAYRTQHLTCLYVHVSLQEDTINMHIVHPYIQRVSMASQ